MCMEKFFEFALLLMQGAAKCSQGGRGANIVQTMHCRCADILPGLPDQVGNQRVNHAAHGFMHNATAFQIRIGRIHFIQMCGKKSHLSQLFKGDQARAQTIIDIMVVVGNLIRQIGDLRFQ